MYLRERVYLASVQPSLLFHLLRCIFWSSVSHVTLHPIPMVTSSLWHKHPNCVHSHCHFRDQSQLVLLKCHCQLYLYNKYNYCFWFDHTGQIPTRPGQKIISLHHGSQALVIWFTVSGTAGLLYRTIAFKHHMKTRSIFYLKSLPYGKVCPTLLKSSIAVFLLSVASKYLLKSEPQGLVFNHWCRTGPEYSLPNCCNIVTSRMFLVKYIIDKTEIVLLLPIVFPTENSSPSPTKVFSIAMLVCVWVQCGYTPTQSAIPCAHSEVNIWLFLVS